MSAVEVFEHAFYIGSYMSGILYGVELVVYFATMRALLRKTTQVRSDRFFMAYSTVLLMLVTIDVATNAVWCEQMLITFASQTGGAAEFIATQASVWYETLSSTSVVALIFMSDALLIYRCFILWSSNYWIIFLPVLTYLGAFALAVCELVAAGVPGGDFFAGRSVNFGVPYYAMSIALNLLLTLLICARLLYLSRWVSTAMGAEGAQLYTSVLAILLESAAPYSAVGIMFLVPYARGSGVAIAFGQVWAKITCLSPQIIVYRVATRRAWDRATVEGAAASMEFVTAGTSTAQLSTIVVGKDTTSIPSGSESRLGSPLREKVARRLGSERSFNAAELPV